MHYLTSSTKKHDHSIWGPRLPQKLNESALSLGIGENSWGIYILNGLEWELITLIMVVCAILGLFISAIYCVLTKDNQTGLAIGAYVAALQAMGLTLFIVKRTSSFI
jgi:hypothetical protein